MNCQYLSRILVGYPSKAADAVLTPASGKQLLVHYVRAYNGSGSLADIGIGVGMSSADYSIWHKSASTADISTDVQAGTASTIFSTTNNHGFYIQAKSKFGLIYFNVSQAEAGSPVYTYQYWDGTTWQTLTTKAVPSSYGAGANYVVFIPPLGWEIGSDDGTLSTTQYTIKVLATTAPSQAVQIDAIKVAGLLSWIDQLNTGQHLQIAFEGARGTLLLQSQEYILPYFSVASAGNILEAAYQVNP
jgi:hypothetical protein